MENGATGLVNQSGRVSLGQSFTFRYNTFRRETTTVDERGISQTYLFNEWGQQLQHVRGDDSRVRYEYTDSAHPLKETLRIHALGYKTKNTYDAAGNLIKTTLPDGSTQKYAGYNAFGLPIQNQSRIKQINESDPLIPSLSTGMWTIF